MEDSPPSYETAVTRDHWTIIAQYTQSRDLCSAALVCRRWHRIFAPHLWGNPASHFGAQNDMVYVALTRFKRTLTWARLLVRELTHTLHLPPAHAQTYGGPHSDWLRDLLERLPRLQALIVNGITFFDHATLLTLRYPSPASWSPAHNSFPIYAIRMLDASSCPNATSTGLREALGHLPSLLYLDLSRTPAARDAGVFDALRPLPVLRVLKLRGVQLRDDDVAILASAIRLRVRSLDIRDNLLSDKSARLLLDACFLDTSSYLDAHGRSQSPMSSSFLHNRYSQNGVHLDQYLRKGLTRGFVGKVPLEGPVETGITDLYISGNKLTVEGISGLVRSGRLQILDVGTIDQSFQRPQSLADGGQPESDLFRLPGAEKLVKVLREHASGKLTYLRIHHSVITSEASPEEALPNRAEMTGSLGMPNSPHLVELGANSVVYELGTDEQICELPGDSHFRAELPGDSVQITVSSPVDVEVTSEDARVRRGSVFAPEPVEAEDNPLLSPISPMTPHSTAQDGRSPSPVSPGPEIPASDRTATLSRSRRNSSLLVQERRSRLNARQSQEHHLHPGMLPKVHTLVLTDTPNHAADPALAQRLIQFVRDCAEESEIAKLQSRSAYALPPGRSRAVAEREFAASLFSLRRIVLEMAPPQNPNSPLNPTVSGWRQYPTKSSTEDADSEAFWTAAEHDFSFFGGEKDSQFADMERSLPMGETSVTGALPPDDSYPYSSRRSRRPAPVVPTRDTIAELAKYRKEKRAAYEAALKAGDADPPLEGHWTGDLTVVRNPGFGKGFGEMDYYGNYFQDGYMYR